LKKIKILVLSVDSDGVGYYRLINPYTYLNDKDIDVEIRLTNDGSLLLNDENYIKNFNIIIYNKNIVFKNITMGNVFMNLIKKYNIKMVYDIDDYWELDSTHINYTQWKKSDVKELTKRIVRMSDHVTTTTPLFSNKIKELNPSVHVFENSLNPSEYQWNSDNKIESDKIRFSWGGGISHMPDLLLLKNSFKMFDKDFIKKSQLYLCGFDLRIRTPNGVMKGDPRDNQWTKFENIFTNNGKWIKNYKYSQFLNKYDDTDYGISEEFRYDNFYQRRWTKPILTYGSMYQEVDVVISPLKETIFNYYKSQLKVIEAGIYKCPIIASNYGPYTLDIENGKDGFLIDNNKPSQWYEKMKWFIKNPTAVKEMGEHLYEKIISKYTIDKVNKKRIEFLKKII
jgi:glycosyltransferase involved in cell wall biosynthesis